MVCLSVPTGGLVIFLPCGVFILERCPSGRDGGRREAGAGCDWR